MRGSYVSSKRKFNVFPKRFILGRIITSKFSRKSPQQHFLLWKKTACHSTSLPSHLLEAKTFLLMLFADTESSRKLNVYMEHPFSPILSAAMLVLNQIAAESPTSLAFSPFINLELPSAIRDCGDARNVESIKQINITRTRI